MYTTDELGRPIYNADSVREALYAEDLDVIHTLEFEEQYDINKFNQFADELDIQQIHLYNAVNTSKLKYDNELSANWLMPEDYKSIDIAQYVLDRCNTNEERQRAGEELVAFADRNLFPLLQYMIYLVDTMRENGIVWGVGRGSSVASFVLYVLGVNKIDPIKYDLDWQEFLR